MGATESKVAFRKGVYALKTGKTESGAPVDEAYINEFVRLPSPDSAEDIFNFLSPKDIRAIRDSDHSDLFAALIRCVSSTVIDAAAAGAVANLSKLTNCVRILTRVLPFVFEIDGLENSLFWGSVDSASSLGAKLTLATIELFFVKAYTLPPTSTTAIWAHGIGCSTYPSQSLASTHARIDMLRLLQTLLSTRMYTPPESIHNTQSRFSSVIATALPLWLAQNLYASLVNTTCLYDPAVERGVVASLIPYNHMVFGDGFAGLGEQYVCLCCQVFVALVDLGAFTRISSWAGGEILLKISEEVSADPSGTLKENDSTESVEVIEAAEVDSSAEVEWENYPSQNGQESQEPQEGLKEKKKTKKEKTLDANGQVVKKKKKERTGSSEKKEKKEKKKKEKSSLAQSPESSITEAVEVQLDEIPTDELKIEGPNNEDKLQEEDFAVPEQTPPDSALLGNNDFRHFVSQVHEKEDLEFVWNGVVRLLRNPLEASATLLPGSTKKASIHIEAMMLFWKFYELNKDFASLVVESEKAIPLTTSLVYFLTETKSNPNEIGLTRMATFLLHILSQERSYAIQLNAPFVASVASASASNLPLFSNGSWADFLVLSIHSVITTTMQSPVSTLHEAMLMTIANMGAYWKSLSVVTVNKMMGLFGVISGPAFLLAKEENHRLVFYLVDFLSMLIGYQAAKNAQLVYALVRNREKIHALENLTFSDAIMQVAKIREAKAKARAVAVNEDGKALVPDEAKERFQPTVNWFTYWKSHLRLTILLSLVDALHPKLEQLYIKTQSNDDRTAIAYIESGTLVGILASPPPLFTRKFMYTEAVRAWFTSYMWGNSFIKCANPSSGGAEVIKYCPSIWTGTEVKLFSVRMLDE
ncbi:cell wall biogenesis protein [Entophlyctis luteolus]|nr:cell wall biogenesis protein [Entophlyctis luteolus]KAJ3346951.1 cell wall biogenesis protein [Entophlyctis luteolus]